MEQVSAREMVRKVVEHINENEEVHKEQMDGYANCIFIIARGLERNDVPTIATAAAALNSLYNSILNEEDDYKWLHQDSDKLFDIAERRAEKFNNSVTEDSDVSKLNKNQNN